MFSLFKTKLIVLVNFHDVHSHKKIVKIYQHYIVFKFYKLFGGFLEPRKNLVCEKSCISQTGTTLYTYIYIYSHQIVYVDRHQSMSVGVSFIGTSNSILQILRLTE